MAFETTGFALVTTTEKMQSFWLCAYDWKVAFPDFHEVAATLCTCTYLFGCVVVLAVGNFQAV